MKTITGHRLHARRRLRIKDATTPRSITLSLDATMDLSMLGGWLNAPVIFLQQRPIMAYSLDKQSLQFILNIHVLVASNSEMPRARAHQRQLTVASSWLVGRGSALAACSFK